MITAPVARFEAVIDKEGGRIIGYAAPKRGMAPCRIQVCNGGRIVAAAAAINYAGNNCSVRLGWCGFTLPLGTWLFPFDDQADIVCAVSGRVLLSLSLDCFDLPSDPVSVLAAIPTSVLDLAEIHTDFTSVPGIVRLVQAVVARTSAEKGVHALYQMLLARHADAVGLQDCRRKMTSKSGIEQAVRLIMSSDEFHGLPPECCFTSPYRSSNAVEPLLALSDIEEDDQVADAPHELTVAFGMSEMVLADRINEEQWSLLHRHRPDTTNGHAWGNSNSLRRPTGSDDRMAKIAATLLTYPSWWGWMPTKWRRAKTSARLKKSGLFDGPAYLRRYPDVAEARLDPLRHYLLHGRHEGRSV
jgi:hypothetical protein